VLHGFSLALVIGIIIGTYSSIFIASPMLVAYQDWRGSRSGRSISAKVADARREKMKIKA
jgi:preprotein translocase subunit SecF